MEIEEQRNDLNKGTKINHTYINSGEYIRKFDLISDSKELSRLLYKIAKKCWSTAQAPYTRTCTG